MEVEVTLLVPQRAVGLDLIRVNPVRTSVRDVEQRLVRGKRDAVRIFHAALIHRLFRAVGFDEPDAARLVFHRQRIRCVNVPVVRHGEVVPFEPIGKNFHRVIAADDEHLRLRSREHKHPPIRPERLAVRPLRVREELRRLPIRAHFIRLARGDVVEENLARRVARRAFRKFVALPHKLPAFARQDDLIEHVVFRRADLRLSGPALPQPPHRVGENRVAVLAIVPLRAPRVIHLVARPRQRPLHRLIRHPPVPAVDI